MSESKIKVGQTLYLSSNGRGNDSGNVAVTKVGRKYGYFTQYGRERVFILDDMTMTPESYPGGRLWISEEEYRKHKEQCNVWSELRMAVYDLRTTYEKPAPASVEAMREAARLLNIELKTQPA